MKPQFTKEKLEHCEGSEAPCTNTNAKWVARGCIYPDERANWAYLCPECTEIEHEHWNDMWQEYWSGVM